MDEQRFNELMGLYLLDRLTDREGAQLARMLQQPEYQAAFEQRVYSQLENKEYDLDAPPESVRERIQASLDKEMNGHSAPVHRVHFIRRPFWRYAAAVILLALAGGGGYIYLRGKTDQPALLSQKERFKNDLQPGANRATLILDDSSKVVLSEGAVLDKTGKQGKNGMNRLSTGKGETYSLVLSDGTKVWLNAASSLIYPASFDGRSERRVRLEGEAYFEVKHNTRLPFSVQLPDGSLVKDLGTRFNVRAYADEPKVKTTLVEGAVEISAGGHQLSLQPGQEVEYSRQEAPTVQSGVDLEQTVAWKDNMFLLKEAHIGDIMKQVERWYNAEVTFDPAVKNDTTQFFGTIPRDVPVSQLLKLLELTGHVHFKIEGNKITVMP